MDKRQPSVTTIDDYIAAFDAPTRERLSRVRGCIAKAAPEATEKISYGMPTFYLHGNLVHFAAMKHHLGFYPTSSGIACFTEELAPYVTSKGAVQFPYEGEVPYALIERITRHRVAENQAKRKPRG